MGKDQAPQELQAGAWDDWREPGVLVKVPASQVQVETYQAALDDHPLEEAEDQRHAHSGEDGHYQ